MSVTPSAPRLSPAPLRLGIAGLGTVGAGVVKLLRAQSALLAARAGRPFEIVTVSARDRTRDRGVSLENLRWVDEAVEMAHAPDIDVVVELIGGAEGPARRLVTEALKAGKSVVTANKALLALHGEELAALSETYGGTLLFEAAVAGGVPAVKLVREGLAGDALSRVGGILNGTCNYILTEMEQSGRDFGDVLKEAQNKGYAEADPTTDVDGWDTAHKLAILAGIAFTPLRFETLPVTGIRDITAADLKFARQLGYRVKLLGMASALPVSENAPTGGVAAWVGPCLVPETSRLAQVNGVFNAVVTEGPFSGPVAVSGRGAGEGPTASAVVGDLVELGRGSPMPVWGRAPAPAPVACAPAGDLVSAFYLRLLVEVRPGVMAEIGSALRDEGVSVHLVSQHDTPAAAQADLPPRAWITVITHPIACSHVERMARQIERLAAVLEAPLVLKIENLS